MVGFLLPPLLVPVSRGETLRICWEDGDSWPGRAASIEAKGSDATLQVPEKSHAFGDRNIMENLKMLCLGSKC